MSDQYHRNNIQPSDIAPVGLYNSEVEVDIQKQRREKIVLGLHATYKLGAVALIPQLSLKIHDVIADEGEPDLIFIGSGFTALAFIGIGKYLVNKGLQI